MSEENDQDVNRPATDSKSHAQNAPVLATLVYETPTGGTINPNHPLPDDEVIQEAPMGEALTPDTPSNNTTVSASATLFSYEEAEQFRTRWNEIQGEFVDEPRLAVEHADALVNEVIEKITLMFAAEYSTLEGKWKQGNDVSTEDLRQTLQGYRAFFDRLMV
jgi:hypothetical protein